MADRTYLFRLHLLPLHIHIRHGQVSGPTIVGETDKQNINRTSERGPAGSIGPKLDAEAASQTNPIHQQSWKSRKNIRLQQESIVQTADISDKAKRESNAAHAEVPLDESDSRGKLELGRFDLQGTTHDIEGDQGIVGLDDNDNLDRNRSTDLVQGWKDKLSLGQVGTGHGADATELTPARGGRKEEGLGEVRQPGDYVGDRGPHYGDRENLEGPPGATDFADSTDQAFEAIYNERGRGGNPSSSDPAYAGIDYEEWIKKTYEATESDSDAVNAIRDTGLTVLLMGAGASAGAERGNKIVPIWGAGVGAIVGMLGGADTAVGMIGGKSMGDQILEAFKGHFGSDEDKKPNPDDPEQPGNDGDGKAALAA